MPIDFISQTPPVTGHFHFLSFLFRKFISDFRHFALLSSSILSSRLRLHVRMARHFEFSLRRLSGVEAFSREIYR